MAKDKDSEGQKGKGAANEPPAGAPADQTADQTETVDGTGPEILRKINPKDVVGGNLAQMALSGKIKLPTDLYTLIGRAANIREGESNFGPWVSLKGEFEAMLLFGDSAGKAFISSECFVPGPAGDLLVAAVRKFLQEPIPVTDEQYKKSGRTYRATGEVVEMALVIGAKIAERAGGAGYEFTVRPLINVQKADPLAALRERTKKLIALPAPK